MADAYTDTITGRILPLEREDEDELYTIMILVDGEEEYVVEPDRTGELLENYVDQLVSATGLVSEKDEGVFIAVEDFTIEESGFAFTDDDNW